MRRASTSLSSTSTAPTCPSRASASSSGCSAARSSGARSPARSRSCPIPPVSSTTTPRRSSPVSTAAGSPTRSCGWSSTRRGGRRGGAGGGHRRGGGAAAVVLPTLLGRLGVDSLIVNGRLDESTPTETLAQHMQGLARLGELVESSRAAFGARFDPVAERLALVDERGRIIQDDRAVLVVMDLVAAERRRGRVALPVTTTRVAERVAAFHGVDIAWTGTAPQLLSAAAAEEDVVFAGDGRGGYVVPEFSAAVDGIAAFTRLVGLVARTKLTMSEIDARIPQAHVLRRSVATPWAAKGTAMRAVLEAAGNREVDTTDGVRVVESDGRWALVLPDPAEAVTHVWAEAGSGEQAEQLLDEWVAVIEAAHA